MSAPTGLILPPFAGAQSDFLANVPIGAVGNAGSPLANFLVCYLVRTARVVAISSISVWIHANPSGGNFDVGVFQSDGTTLTQLASSGSTVAGSATTVQTVALTATVYLHPGIDYYYALITDNGTVTFGRASMIGAGIGAVEKQSVVKSQTFPLPTTVALSTLTSGVQSIYWLHGS